MNPASLKPTQRAAILGAIDPQSVASGASVSTAWVSAALANRICATLMLGALTAGATVDAKWQQATNAAGAGAKDVPERALVSIPAATGSGKQAHVNLKAEDLDTNGGFAFVRLTVAVAGAAAVLAAVLQGFDFREGPASDNAAATVVQTVG